MNPGQQLKIVHLDTGMDLRGGQQQLLLLARGLRQRGHHQLLVCPEGSRLEARAQREGFSVFALPAHDPGRLHGIFLLRQLGQAEPSRVFHAHDGRGQTLAWLASAGMGVRRIASRRVTFMPAGLLGHRLKYERTCHAIIAISEFVRGLLVSSGVSKTRIEVIPDGIELPGELPGSKARAEARAQWGLSDQEFVLGHLGAFAPEKGQDVAVEAAMLLAAKLPQARLMLAGDGPRRRMQQMSLEIRKTRGRVQLLGYLENLSGFFSALDLFLMPSRTEGLGSSALLAMAHGLAVVASRAGGLPEIVKEGKTGWLVPPGSAPALADAIIAAASDRARLGQFSANARERARQYSSEKMVERTEALYYRLLAPSRKD